MGLASFKGGVHPYDGKALSKDKPVVVLLPKGNAVFPLSQHIGAPAVPVVEPGEHVLCGQKIAEAGGFVSSPIVSSVSGTVKSIAPVMVANGSMVNAITVENDGLFEKLPEIGTERDYRTLSKDEIKNIIKEAGIVGLGGAGFPTHVKLSPKDPDGIQYIIVNGAECEPYLTSDYRMMLEEPHKLVGGLEIMLSLFDNAKGVIAIEDNKPDGIESVRKACEGHQNISVLPLKTKYPQGCERMLINAVTGRTLNSSMLPADVGCIVDNVDTVISVFKAVAESTPLMRRIFTITGDAVAEPGNFSVRIGTNIQEIVEAAGGFKEDPEKILAGGPMMGPSVFKLDFPIVKTSSALTCFTHDAVAANAETACICCGRCVKACPEHLVPVFMIKAALANDLEGFEKMNGMECMECGSCTFVCPAKRPLTQSFKDLRGKVAAKRREEAAKAKAAAAQKEEKK